ncbi:MAG: hypothetical protein KBA82_01415 [Nitrosomonas sp.]|nr:hypothetical protein [Nitrosomonas sp.]
MNRRNFTAAVVTAPLMTGCIYDRYFDIEWDEEVLLHDGRVIIVHVKNTYERRGGGLKKYDETKITFRRKELIFEAAPGKFVTFSTRMPVAYLGNFDNDWFVVISGQGPYGNYPDELPTRWGNNFSTLEQRLAILQNGTFLPVDWDRSPSALTTMNMLESAFFIEYVAWNKKRITLEQKKIFNNTYPSPYGQQITRPLNRHKVTGDTK